MDLPLRSSAHREELQAAGAGNGFSCLRSFHPDQISEWIDRRATALCPHRGIDAVLPGNIGAEVLQAMHAAWFGTAG